MQVVEHPVVAAFGIAALARVLVAVASFVLNPVYLVPDENQYLALARAVASGAGAESYVQGYGQALYESTWVFSAPIAAAFRVVEPTRLLPQLYAAAFGALTAAATVALARRFVPVAWALGAGVVVALLPSQVLWSSVVLRESLIWAALAGIALCLSAMKPVTVRALVLGTVAVALLLLALIHLRSQTAVVAAWAAAFAAFLGVGRLGVVRGAAVSVVAGVLPLLTGLGPFGLDLVTDAASTMARTRAYLSFDADTAVTSIPPYEGPGAEGVCPERKPSRSTTSTSPGAVALAGTERRSVELPDGSTVELICGPDLEVYAVEAGASRDLRYLPSGIATALLRPLPWERADNLSARLAAVENVVWIPLYLGAIAGAVVGRRRLDVISFPVLVAGGLVLAGALSQGNAGTAFRHRAQVLWALAPLAALAFRALAERRGRAVA